MFGIRSRCELVYAWLGASQGMFAGLMLLQGILPLASMNSREFAIVWLAVSLAGLLFCAMVFRVFFRQQFWVLFVSMLLGALLLGMFVTLLAQLLASPIAEPFAMWLLGLLLGAALGRLLCAWCRNIDFVARPTRALDDGGRHA